MADMKITTGWMKYVEILEIAESRGVPAQFDAELCGLIAKSIRHKETAIEAQEAEIKRLRESLQEMHDMIFEGVPEYEHEGIKLRAHAALKGKGE